MAPRNKIPSRSAAPAVQVLALGLAALGASPPVRSQPQERKRAAPPPPVTIQAPGTSAPAPVEPKAVEQAAPEQVQAQPATRVAAPASLENRAATATMEQAQVLGGVPRPRSGAPGAPWVQMATGQATGPEAARSSLLLERLGRGEGVDEMAHKGEIGVADVRYLLAERVEPWGFFNGQDAVETRRALARWLLQNDKRLEEQIAQPQVLPRTLRLWVADYLGSVGDERVIAVCEQILKDTPLPLGGDDGQGDKPLVFQTIERMARYLGDRGKHAESGQMWQRLPSFYTAREWWNADAMIEAGRAYEAAGQSSQSRAAYIQAISGDNDGFASGALWEYANHLIRQGQVDAAQQFVLQFEPKAPEVLGRKGFIAASLLGYLHYLKGEWKEARQSYELCLARRAQLATPKQREDARDIAASAQKMLRLIGQWEAHPLVSDPERIDIAVGQEAPDAPITRRFLVSMFREVPLKLSSSNAQVQLAVEDSPWAADSQPLQFEKQIVVSIPPSLLRQETAADIVISSPQLPKYLLHIPLKITKAHE